MPCTQCVAVLLINAHYLDFLFFFRVSVIIGAVQCSSTSWCTCLSTVWESKTPPPNENKLKGCRSVVGEMFWMSSTGEYMRLDKLHDVSSWAVMMTQTMTWFNTVFPIKCDSNVIFSVYTFKCTLVVNMTPSCLRCCCCAVTFNFVLFCFLWCLLWELLWHNTAINRSNSPLISCYWEGILSICFFPPVTSVGDTKCTRHGNFGWYRNKTMWEC